MTFEEKGLFATLRMILLLKDRALLDLVNKNIQALQGEESEERFVGSWMLIAHWDGVHPSPHGGDDHGGISEEELDRVC